MTSQCCILNPLASMTTCTASGGKVDTDPCNVLSPAANKSVCTTKNSAETVKTVTGGTMSGLAIFGIVIGVMVGITLLIVGGMFLFGAAMSSTSTGGGRSITKFVKHFFKK